MRRSRPDESCIKVLIDKFLKDLLSSRRQVVDSGY